MILYKLIYLNGPPELNSLGVINAELTFLHDSRWFSNKENQLETNTVNPTQVFHGISYDFYQEKNPTSRSYDLR